MIKETSIVGSLMPNYEQESNLWEEGNYWLSWLEVLFWKCTTPSLYPVGVSEAWCSMYLDWSTPGRCL